MIIQGIFYSPSEPRNNQKSDAVRPLLSKITDLNFDRWRKCAIVPAKMYRTGIHPGAYASIARGQGAGLPRLPSAATGGHSRVGSVKPSQTIMFFGHCSLTLWQTRSSIRLIREISGSPSQPSLTTSHWPLATTAPAQYGLIRPNTALNFPGKGKSGYF